MAGQRRTALVTGSNKNIGRACVLHLARAGCNVVINGARDRAAADSVAREAKALGVEALVAMGDVGKRVECLAIADAALKQFDSVDILVNNAALRENGGFLEMSEDDWRYAMAVNFDSAYWLARKCLPGMVAKGWGRIINFAGMNAIHGYNGRAHVSASKHAAWGLTKAAHIATMKAKVPVGRLGTPDEVAAAVALIASDGGAFINGQMIQVNGGAET